MFGIVPRVRASAPLNLRLATIARTVDPRIQWAAEALADAYDAWGREQRTRRTPFKPPAGAQWIGAGGTREVYRIGDYVVKLARTEDYTEVNAQEAKTWREAPAEVRRYLVPVLAVDETSFGGPRWLIMPHAPQKVPETSALGLCWALRRRFPEVFYDCEHTDNWRYYQGHARLIDYPEDLGQNTRRYAHGRKG